MTSCCGKSRSEFPNLRRLKNKSVLMRSVLLQGKIGAAVAVELPPLSPEDSPAAVRLLVQWRCYLG